MQLSLTSFGSSILIFSLFSIGAYMSLHLFNVKKRKDKERVFIHDTIDKVSKISQIPAREICSNQKTKLVIAARVLVCRVCYRQNIRVKTLADILNKNHATISHYRMYYKMSEEYRDMLSRYIKIYGEF